MMGEWGIAVGAVIAIAGILVGYFFGYRSGLVAGELAALKAHRANSRRRERRESSSSEEDD